MVFSSITFLFYFLPVFLILYYLTGEKYKNFVILAFSVLFYAWGAPKFVFILLLNTSITFYIVKYLNDCNKEKKRKVFLALAVIINLGLLIYFKYANFFLENFNELLTILGFQNVSWTKVALPIGISFYTFQTLTYAVDVYRKHYSPLDKLTDYLLYIIMFPQLIAGPIVRFGLIADQIRNRKESIRDFLSGFIRFGIGLAKKVLLANVLGEVADDVFNSNVSEISNYQAWIGIIAYTFQIYYDFSGYSDMAIGIGRMIGFRFPENFNSPYISRSITEFWKRWHITLSSWMRDYLYIPLGGSKVKSKSRLYFNLWFVFLISGFWHGAAWNFVLWGIYHGVFLVLERMFFKKYLEKIPAFLQIAYSFLAVVLGWVIFRIENTSKAFDFYLKLFSFDFNVSLSIFSKEFYFILIISVLFAFITMFKFGRRFEKIVLFYDHKDSNFYVLFLLSSALIAISIASIASEGFNPFIYFRF